MYAIACLGTSGRLARPPGPISASFRVSVVPNIMLGLHGQFRGLGMTLWSNALGVSSDDDYDNPVNVPTSTLKLKLCMVIFFFRYNFFKHEQNFAMVF